MRWQGVEGNGILVMCILCTHYQGTLITQATILLHRVYEGWDIHGSLAAVEGQTLKCLALHFQV